MPIDRQVLAQELRAARENRGMSQQTAAERAAAPERQCYSGMPIRGIGEMRASTFDRDAGTDTRAGESPGPERKGFRRAHMK